MKNNIFVIFTAFLAVVVVALLFTIATIQSENDKLRNVIRNQAAQTSKMSSYYDNLIARGIYANDPMYKALDKSNTRIQVNMK